MFNQKKNHFKNFEANIIKKESLNKRNQIKTEENT